MNELDFRLDDFYKEIDGLKVSSHILIKRTGEIIQFVPFNQELGMLVYTYKGRDDCNDFSIGIELEGSEDDIFEDIQYEKLSQITEILLREYTGLSKEDIRGHSDIALVAKQIQESCLIGIGI